MFAYVGLPQNLKDLTDQGLRTDAPLEDHPLDTHREPSALYCCILEILYCTPKGRRALLWIPSTEGRSAYVGRNQNLKDLITALCKDAELCCGPRLRKGEVFAYVELPQNLKDLKDLWCLTDFTSPSHTIPLTLRKTLHNHSFLLSSLVSD